ncbi:unnamed protein product [Rangifer tarandus platyrhynchus]|uniref:Uncharacterized protein n=1 Tax=Rangifer tarandus platyrhynchus TaxID=3082113 RepID=A0ABN8Z3N5_RANTA|nr:unnamed protein product [Rangifer tarandus platyrhynchus]
MIYTRPGAGERRGAKLSNRAWGVRLGRSFREGAVLTSPRCARDAPPSCAGVSRDGEFVLRRCYSGESWAWRYLQFLLASGALSSLLPDVCFQRPAPARGLKRPLGLRQLSSVRGVSLSSAPTWCGPELSSRL